jgi:putative aminopeptidase FrvX
MLISRKEMAKKKIEKIKDGYSAFAETKEVADYLKKELEKMNIDVHEDITELGVWFIPKVNKK